MAKKTLARLMFLVLLLSALAMCLAGCSGLFKPKKNVQVDIHQGVEGLSMSFLQNAPPKELTAPAEGQRIPFQAGVKIENRGAHDIKEGYLLLAVEKSYMNILGWQLAEDEHFEQLGASGERLTFKIDGRSQEDPSIKTEVVVADVEALPLEKQSVTHASAVAVTACYDYQTVAAGEVCIDTDVYNLKPIEKTCTIKDISLSGGQGGPVSIDKIEVSMLPDGKEFVKPQFVIYISNKGGGIVFRPDMVMEACSSSPLKSDEMNVVTLDDITFSGFSLRAGHIECTPANIKLKGNENKIVCSTKRGIISAEAETYSTSLQVMLSYGYSQTISSGVTINRP